MNLDGEVVGINTAIASRTGGYQGVGFAVSSNLAKWVSQQLIASGTVRRSYLGVAIQPVSQDLAKQFGVEARQGVVVADVQSEQPGRRRRTEDGRRHRRVRRQAGHQPARAPAAVEQAPIGGKQGLTVMRDGKRTALEVMTREQPADYGLARGESMTPGKEGTFRDKKLGIEVSNLTADVAEKLGVKAGEGVVITEVRNGSPAALAGLGTGMVIVQVNRQPVKSVEEFHAAMEKQSLAERRAAADPLRPGHAIRRDPRVAVRGPTVCHCLLASSAVWPMYADHCLQASSGTRPGNHDP